MKREINTLVIHCTDTPNGRTLFTGKLGDANFTTPAQEIDRWHQERGFRRAPEWRTRHNPALASIGYHMVIYTNGAIAGGRHFNEIGAHAHGHNATSLGICLVGRDQFTFEQWQSLRDVVSGIKKSNPSIRVIAHHDVNPDKSCPNFDVAAWLESGMAPVAGQIYTEPKLGGAA